MLKHLRMPTYASVIQIRKPTVCENEKSHHVKWTTSRGKNCSVYYKNGYLLLKITIIF